MTNTREERLAREEATAMECRDAARADMRIAGRTGNHQRMVDAMNKVAHWERTLKHLVAQH